MWHSNILYWSITSLIVSITMIMREFIIWNASDSLRAEHKYRKQKQKWKLVRRKKIGWVFRLCDRRWRSLFTICSRCPAANHGIVYSREYIHNMTTDKRNRQSNNPLHNLPPQPPATTRHFSIFVFFFICVYFFQRLQLQIIDFFIKLWWMKNGLSAVS